MKGSTNEERLYLYDSPSHGVLKTNMPNMSDIIARHKARYHLAAFLARPDMKVLDFPCGSGYGAAILDDVHYTGMDIDRDTIHYARSFYPFARFFIGDLEKPELSYEEYDLILCIEGLEHLEMNYHHNLMCKFYLALKPGGRLLVSMPEAPGKSGPSLTNKYHVGELTIFDFHRILRTGFDDVQLFWINDILHNGIKSTLLYAICQKEGI